MALPGFVLSTRLAVFVFPPFPPLFPSPSPPPPTHPSPSPPVRHTRKTLYSAHSLEPTVGGLLWGRGVVASRPPRFDGRGSVPRRARVGGGGGWAAGCVGGLVWGLPALRGGGVRSCVGGVLPLPPPLLCFDFRANHFPFAFFSRKVPNNHTTRRAAGAPCLSLSPLVFPSRGGGVARGGLTKKSVFFFSHRPSINENPLSPLSLSSSSRQKRKHTHAPDSMKRRNSARHKRVVVVVVW